MASSAGREGVNKQCIGLGMGLLLMAALIFPAEPSAAPYYEGKMITIIVGATPGGGYDRMARLLAKHYPKHLPGKPSFIVQNLPGANGMIAANYLYNVGKPDGLSLLATHKSLVFMQILKAGGTKFDVRRFGWIGSSAADAEILVIRSDLPYKTIDELIKSKKKIFLGGAGATAPNSLLSNLARDFIGLNIERIDYPGGAEILLAIERKELDGLFSPYNTINPHIKRGLVRPLLRTRVTAPGIEHLPVNEDLATDAKGRTIMAIMGSTAEMGRIFVTPPKTPDHLLRLLREGFANVLKDREFIADAEKMQMELKYLSDKECLNLVHYMFNQPPEIIEVFDKYIKF